MSKHLFQTLISLSIFTLTAFSQIKLPSLICDNMVIQRDCKITIWGSGRGKVTLRTNWADKAYSVDCDAEGNWKLEIQTPSAGGPYQIDIADADSNVKVTNVLAGEVWLCSGQSNMQFPLMRDNTGGSEVALANYPDIRLFTVEPACATEPQTQCGGKWELCRPEAAKAFSAVGYFFGKQLYAYLNVPIGLIDNSWGGTPAETWVKHSVISEDDDLKPILARDEEILANQDVYQKQYDQMLADWQKQVEQAQAAGKKAPSKPFPPAGLRPQNRASRLYNAMICPLVNYRIKGVIWYQGESNADRAYQYRELFAKLIENWRNDWKQPQMPFYFVQLANFYTQSPNDHPPVWPQQGEPIDHAWAELREAQTMALSLENTGMACIIDIGEPYDIHPRNKVDVGLRLSLWALNKTYGISDLVVSGPMYKSMNVEDDKVRISFDHVAGGLSALGSEVEGFAIAGSDKKFYWADAVIDGDTVVVHSDKVNEPVAVRYGWSGWTDCNLYNDQRLPAVPFRTDSWKGITDDNR